MRLSQWPGPHLATYLPPAAEIRVCGSGKVSPGPSKVQLGATTGQTSPSVS